MMNSIEYTFWHLILMKFHDMALKWCCFIFHLLLFFPQKGGSSSNIIYAVFFFLFFNFFAEIVNVKKLSGEFFVVFEWQAEEETLAWAGESCIHGGARMFTAPRLWGTFQRKRAKASGFFSILPILPSRTDLVLVKGYSIWISPLNYNNTSFV